MRQRGRLSAEGRGAVSLKSFERPEPPKGLTKRQAEEWRAIVGRMPATWFLRETHAMLAGLVRMVERAEDLAAQIERMKTAGEAGTPEYWTQVRLEIDLNKQIMSAMSKMRISQQSTVSQTKSKTLEIDGRVSGRQSIDRSRQQRISGGDEEDSAEAA